jgi:hypothetical protein
MLQALKVMRRPVRFDSTVLGGTVQNQAQKNGALLQFRFPWSHGYTELNGNTTFFSDVGFMPGPRPRKAIQ